MTIGIGMETTCSATYRKMKEIEIERANDVTLMKRYGNELVRVFIREVG